MRWKHYTLIVLSVIYAVIIFFFSSLSNPLPGVISVNVKDYVLHFIEYSILALLLMLAEFRSKWRYAVVAAIGYLFAASDEIHQYFTPGRVCSFSDWAVDCLAISIIILLFYLFENRKPFIEQQTEIK